jgi:hypothetical protein
MTVEIHIIVLWIMTPCTMYSGYSRRRHYVLLKNWYHLSTLHDVIIHETITCRTSHLANLRWQKIILSCTEFLITKAFIDLCSPAPWAWLLGTLASSGCYFDQLLLNFIQITFCTISCYCIFNFHHQKQLTGFKSNLLPQVNNKSFQILFLGMLIHWNSYFTWIYEKWFIKQKHLYISIPNNTSVKCIF